MNLTLNKLRNSKNIINPIYPRIDENSSFYDSYRGCLFNYSEYNNSYSSQMDEINKLNLTNMNETYLIDVLFSKDVLNKIGYTSNSYISKDDYFEKYACYAISILKTIYIRNLIFERNYKMDKSFTLFLDNKTLFYPPRNMTNLNEVIDFDNKNNEIYFENPKFVKSSLTTRACIPIRYPKDYACIEYNLGSIFPDSMFNNNSLINLFIISNEVNDNDIEMIYWNRLNSNTTDKIDLSSITNSNLLFSNTMNDSSLFNGLYYDLLQNTIKKNTNASVSDLISQYKDIKTNLVDIMNKTSCNDDDIIGNFTHYLYYSIIEESLTGNKSSNYI
jgi:hypothetical protein